MFGMEIETRIPLNIQLPDGDRWPTIMRARGNLGFKVDVDQAHGPVAEFVMSALDDHTGTSAEAVAAFEARFANMKLVIDTFANSGTGTTLAFLAGMCNLEIDPELKQAVTAAEIADYVPPAAKPLQTKLDGPVHYTLGIGLHVLPRLIADKLVGIGQHGESRRRAGEASDLGERLTGPGSELGAMPKAEFSRAKMHGYLALVSMHVAALKDGCRNPGGGYTKHRTQALCRVPLFTVFQSFTETEQNWLMLNWPGIKEAIEETWSVKAPAVAADYGTSADGKEESTKLAMLLNGAFGFRKDNPEDIWGSMTVIDRLEQVGPAGATCPAVALELRHLPIGAGNHDELRRFSVDLLKYDRMLHDTDPATPTVPKRKASVS